jgi:hypothetical protein
MGLLGEMLVERGAISTEQLHAALSARSNGSARLGACLVENGFIDETSLLEALAEQHSVPFVSEPMLLNFLGSMDNAVMPQSMLRQLKAVPFRQVRDRIQVAMSNPDDSRVIDRIANYTQLHVEPFIASDRVIDAVIDNADPRDPADSGEAEQSFEAEVDEKHTEWEELWAPRTDPEALFRVNGRSRSASTVLVASFPSLIPVDSSQESVPEKTTDDHGLGPLFSNARTASVIAEVLADFAAQRLDRVCLFAVLHGKISGWMCRGLTLDARVLRSFSIFADTPSVFWEVHENDCYVGPIPSGPVNDDLTRLIGNPIPTEVLVVPMLMDGRAKGYLLGDIPSRGVPGRVRNDVLSAARAAGDALAAVLRGQS